MAKIVQFHERVKGGAMENEDWWHLVTEDNGETLVRHSWSHMGRGSLKVTDGERTFTVEEFLTSNASYSAKEALRKLIEEGQD